MLKEMFLLFSQKLAIENTCTPCKLFFFHIPAKHVPELITNNNVLWVLNVVYSTRTTLLLEFLQSHVQSLLGNMRTMRSYGYDWNKREWEGVT